MSTERFQRLQDLFHAAIRKDAEERVAYVHRAAADDPDLRDEVLALLATHRDDDTFLENPPLAADGPEPLAPGQSIGPYRIMRKIDQGGQGFVYLAKDTGLRRDVALKALAPRLLSDPRHVERFRREAERAASISHPGVATVHALEEVRGNFYLVSEYVPGETLRAEMRRVKMGLGAALDAGLQIAEALEAIHEKGIVHRDLKPENVIRSRSGQLKIVDFGLALIQDSPSPEPRLTEETAVIGSLAYMSPEQIEADAIDFRSDLFSFGILLAEMATGKHPFEGRTNLSTTARILENEPAGLEELSTRSPALAGLIGRCLAKNPTDRHESTSQVVAEMRGLQAGAHTEPRPAPASGSEEKERMASHWWSFHQGAVVAFYAVVIFMLAWNTGQEDRSLATLACVYTVALCAIANGALRSHLLFTAHFNPGAILGELDRTRVWVQILDGLLVASLLGASATIIGDSHLMAGVLAALAVAYAVVFLVAEPSTARSVFLAGPERRAPKNLPES